MSSYSLRVSEYLTGVLILGTVFMLVVNLNWGLGYGLAAIGILIPLRYFRVPTRYQYVLLLTAGTVWLTHLLRPLVVLTRPDSFMYPRLGSIGGGLIRSSLVEIGLMGFAILAGQGLGFRIFARREPHPPSQRNILVSGRLLVNALILGLVLFKLIILVRFGVGLRGSVTDPRISVISRLLPELLVYAVAVLYLVRYRHEVPFSQKAFIWTMLAFMGVLGLLQGSKAFIAQILIALFISTLASRGDFRFPLRWAVLSGAACVILIASSFPLATTVRRTVKDSGYSLRLFEEAVLAMTRSVTPAQFGYMSEWVTSRFLGFDGLLATELYRPPELVRTFSFKATATRVLERLSPLTGGNEMSSGRAVGIYLFGHPEDVDHAGGVGLFAAYRLMAGPIGGLVALFITGVLIAWYFTQADRIPQDGGRFLVRYVGAYGIIWWTMSGNSDYVLPILLISVAQVLVLGGLLRFMVQALR